MLTVQSFAWSSGGATKQKALLGSATARARLAKHIAAAVRDRGADGVNLDFEPLAAGYADEFVALVKRVRTELDAVAKGYQLTFDTTGYIGNYPIEEATAAGARRCDLRHGLRLPLRRARAPSARSPRSADPPTTSSTRSRPTRRACRHPSSSSACPYYGRAWSTDTDKLNAEQHQRHEVRRVDTR